MILLQNISQSSIDLVWHCIDHHQTHTAGVSGESPPLIAEILFAWSTAYSGIIDSGPRVCSHLVHVRICVVCAKYICCGCGIKNTLIGLEMPSHGQGPILPAGPSVGINPFRILKAMVEFTDTIDVIAIGSQMLSQCLGVLENCILPVVFKPVQTGSLPRPDR